MLESAKQLFEGIKQTAQAVAPGLNNIGSDLKAEISRLFTQGSMEVASVIYTGSAFVPYGPGQYTPSTEHSAAAEPTPDHSQELEHSRGGMER